MAQSRKSIQSRKRRQERIRQEKHARRQEDAWERQASPSPFDMERLLRLAQAFRKAGRFQDEAEERVFIDSVTTEQLYELLADRAPDPVEDAQELAFQAMEAESREEALNLAREALKLDPRCLDAQCLAAGLEAKDAAGALALLRPQVEETETRLGEAWFREREGRCWDLPEARPVLRALSGLAELQEQAGRPGEAAAGYERLLSLDPGDALEHRFALVRASLAAGRLKELRLFLHERQKEEASAVYAWADVLERFRSEALPGARQALAKARKVNPWLEDFLTGKRRLPRTTTHASEPGSPGEAAYAMAYLQQAWTEDRSAMAWLLRGGKVPGE